ncbi:collagen alpha-1(I) chain-like isoform X3 [Passer domesticus]|uniref:collagen alpha-1(I) chain-like isoform X3 n=1 Tax=Passer domesticus TaxID=48849 RepID=UPI0030FEBD81
MRRHLGFPGNRCRGGRGSRESPGFPARLRAAAGSGRASPPGRAGPGRAPLPRGVPGPAPPPLAGAAGAPGEQRPRPQRKDVRLDDQRQRKPNKEKLLLWKSPEE